MDLANEAIRICEDASKQGRACAQYLPSLLRHRASIETTLKQFEAAEADARRAVDLLLQRAEPGEISQATGEAYLTLARCLAAKGRDADAQAMARRAANQLQRSIGPDHPDTRSAKALAGETS